MRGYTIRRIEPNLPGLGSLEDAILKIQDEHLKRDQPIFELAKEIQVARHRMEQAIKNAGPIGRVVLYKTLDDDIRFKDIPGQDPTTPDEEDACSAVIDNLLALITAISKREGDR